MVRCHHILGGSPACESAVALSVQNSAHPDLVSVDSPFLHEILKKENRNLPELSQHQWGYRGQDGCRKAGGLTGYQEREREGHRPGSWVNCGASELRHAVGRSSR